MSQDYMVDSMVDTMYNGQASRGTKLLRDLVIIHGASFFRKVDYLMCAFMNLKIVERV